MNFEWLQIFQTKNAMWAMTANKKWSPQISQNIWALIERRGKTVKVF